MLTELVWRLHVGLLLWQVHICCGSFRAYFEYQICFIKSSRLVDLLCDFARHVYLKNSLAKASRMGNSCSYQQTRNVKNMYGKSGLSILTDSKWQALRHYILAVIGRTANNCILNCIFTAWIGRIYIELWANSKTARIKRYVAPT